MYEGWEEPELRLHQLRQLRLGFPRSFQTHDSGLLGEPFPVGGLSSMKLFGSKPCLVTTIVFAHEKKILLILLSPTLKIGLTIRGLLGKASSLLRPLEPTGF